ncbi:MAG: multicopper oxidase domain-containing protein [Ardenticatenaceae bacterium]
MNYKYDESHQSDKPFTMGYGYNRRDFLRLVGGLGVTTTFGGLLSACTSPTSEAKPPTSPTSKVQPPTNPPPKPPTALAEQVTSSSYVPDVEFALRAVPSQVSILSGKPTNVWTYQGEVLKGDPSALQIIENSYLGPIIRVRKGQKVRIHFTNELPSQSIIHWHGLHVPEAADGHPRYAIGSGETYVYEFEVRNRAGSYWYHPHPHGQTGSQVYQGLAGLFLVSDDEEAALDLPSGAYDVPLVIQDRLFDANNQLVYLPNGMHDRMMGFLGDQILVNGQPNFTLPVASRAYRLRLLNGSNSRIYKVAWHDGTPLTVIGIDGGLLEVPVQREYVTLAPAQRVELWVDFSGRPVGTEMVLQSLSFDDGEMMGGMMGGAMGGSLAQGSRFSLLTARVERAEDHPSALPPRLTTIPRLSLADTVNGKAPRRFSFAMQGMIPAINGRTFEMEGVAKDEIVRLNTLELWELANDAGGGGMMGGQGNGSGMMGRGNGRGNGMMGRGNGQGNGMMGMIMPHPVHIHELQFQIVERQIQEEHKAAWQTVSDGHVDEGWHDVVLLMPGERVKVLLKFEDYEGLFLYHCHNLEHEDMGMMRNYRVQA